MRRFHSFTWSALALMAVLTVVAAREGQAAAPTEGAILGQVRDLDSGQPVAGVTVVASGPEGDVAVLTDAKGSYQFRALPIGRYTLRFHRGEVLAEREATVSVDKTVRVNMHLPAVPAQVETVAAAYSAPAIDVGSSRIGSTFGPDFIDGVPNAGANVASLMEKTPGGYEDTPPAYQGNRGVSLAGGTGADNAYFLEGMNVTALRDGLLGTNLHVAFLEEAEVVSSGYGAEYGRALGGVVNMALKSGSNAWKGSAFSWVAPGWMAGAPQRILSRSTVLTGNTEPDYTTQVGAEVGGPIIKNKLFVWMGYVPEINRSHFVQYVDRFTANQDGTLASNSDGSPIADTLFTRVIPGESTTHNYAGKLTWRVGPEHVLNLSLVGIRRDDEFMRGANMDLLAGMTHELTNRHDIIAHWQSALFERKWRIDATLGLHMEGYSRRSPYGDAESVNDITWTNSPSLAQFDPRLAPYCPDDPVAGFQSCPVQGYQSGGYGIMRDTSALRWAGQIKSTNIFTALGLHELKYGLDLELNQYDSKVWNSGLNGERGSVVVESDSSLKVNSFYRNSYQDSFASKTSALNFGAFVQESYLPLPNLTVNLGLRWEGQRIADYAGNTALSIYDSFAPRIGVVYDPTNEGRSKIFAHYGRYYESIPMDLADRAFGGQGVLETRYSPSPTCRPETLGTCTLSGLPFQAAAANLAVQKNIKGSYNDEVVLGSQYQYLRNLVVGASFIYRRLGQVVEDTSGSLAEILDGTASPILTNPTDPKPERTYTALQLTTVKRLARNWFFAGSYTYSRTMGNYTGLYDADNLQLNPNLSSQYDIKELMANRSGALPNDRPHVIHLDGYYRFVRKQDSFSPGISFVGHSGQPVTPLGTAPVAGSNETFILPRGSAGRTPFVTQLDAHFSYRTKLSQNSSAEVFVDIFNILNRKTALTVDALYTYDQVMPAASGADLAKVPKANDDGTSAGVPIARNPNYLRPTSYQAPISGRLGMRIWF